MLFSNEDGDDDDVLRPKTYRPVDNVTPSSVDDTGHLPNLLIYQRCNKTLGYKHCSFFLKIDR